MIEDDDYICPDPIRSYDVKFRIMEWIDVKKKLPQDDKEVLIWDGNYIEIGFMEYKDGAPVIWRNVEWMETNHISHWMPLPSPPSL